MVNTKKRGLTEDIICQLCNVEEDTLFHALMQCTEARVIWRLSPLRLGCRHSNEYVGLLRTTDEERDRCRVMGALLEYFVGNMAKEKCVDSFHEEA